jgi:hypothetical protein
MARKKSPANRQVESSSSAATAELSARKIMTGTDAPATVSPSKSSKNQQQERFWLEGVTVLIARSLGSLQVAVVLLVWFAVVLGVGTVVESWYDGKTAQDLVYRTWWFKLLLFLLGINIFFAAAKKWPWKKYQTGFLITHVGLLTLVAGGVVTSFSGTDAQLALIDSAQRDIQHKYGMKQEGSRANLTDETLIRVQRPDGSKEPARDYPFDPGPLPWRQDEYLKANIHPLLGVLSFLDHPLPRHWEDDIGDGTVLKVLGYYPHARQEDYSQAHHADNGAPAVKVALKSPIFGRLPNEPWLVLKPGDQVFPLGPGLIEMLGRCSGPLAEEFLHPPAPTAVGGKGQLVLYVDGKCHRISVDQNLGKTVDVGNRRVQITRYTADLNAKDSKVPAYPMLGFELTDPDGTATQYLTLARYAGLAIALKDGAPAGGNPPGVHVWYHPPDYRYGKDEAVRGVLQFAAGDDDKLYYRSFNSHGDRGLSFEGSGEAKQGGGDYPIWKGMNWQFQVKEYLPQAIAKVRYVPEDARPGLRTERLSPVIRCQLVRGTTKSEEFWLSQNGKTTSVQLGNDTLTLSYFTKTRPLDFDIKLLRAEQTVDPGTQNSATYSSYVQLTDKGTFSADWVPGPIRGVTNFLGLTGGGEKIDGQDRVITMNHPLDHRGYKVYQSTYGLLAEDDNQKPVSYSGFTVGRDPGLPLKYLGSSMLALGIACMFYMKAYFFKPRGKSAPASA